MKKLITLTFICFIISSNSNAQNNAQPSADRKLWLSYLDKIARPVLSNLAADQLKQKMPVVLSPHVDNKENRLQASYLEAFGRTLSGISAWLNVEGGSARK